MKRATEKAIRQTIKDWLEVQAIIVNHKKSNDNSPSLVSDLEKLAKSYEQSVFRICVEEYK